MPLWGRPPGARGSERRREWEREQFAYREQPRIQELDSDDDYSYGGGGLTQKRFSSDPLHFTGTDIGAHPRRSYVYEGSESSGDTDELGQESDMQMGLRDKEEALVEGALARIQRAQEKGKREVELSPEELAALERRRKRMEAAEKRKTSNDRNRYNDRIAVPLSQLEPLSRRSKPRRDERPPQAPPGMLVEGPDGTLTYAPIGQHPSQRNSPGSRPRSSTHSRETPPVTSRQYMPPTGRHFSDGNRPDDSSGRYPPHEDSWQPRSHGNSTYPADPFDFMDPDQLPSIPAQYLDPRRNHSGPEIQYSTRPGSNVYPSSAYMRGNQVASHSDPMLARRPAGREVAGNSCEDSSDELGRVQVDRDSGSSVPRKPVARRKKKTHR